MAVAGTPEQLMGLLCAAARTAGGDIGLLSSADVARVLGRHPNWVRRHALWLGGFRLPGSDEWRFSPEGVAAGVLGPHDTASMTPVRPDARHGRRLAYPPAKQVLADRPRRTARDLRGEGRDAPAGARKR